MLMWRQNLSGANRHLLGGGRMQRKQLEPVSTPRSERLVAGPSWVAPLHIERELGHTTRDGGATGKNELMRENVWNKTAR